MTALKQVAASLVLGVLAVGCATPNPSQVPSDAKVQMSSIGQMSFRTPSDGTIYMYNKSTGKLEYQGDVKGDKMVEYDPTTKLLTADGKRLTEQEFVRGDVRELYFKSDRESRTVVRTERTVERDRD
jgi:hypothetical protein